MWASGVLGGEMGYLRGCIGVYRWVFEGGSGASILEWIPATKGGQKDGIIVYKLYFVYTDCLVVYSFSIQLYNL